MNDPSQSYQPVTIDSTDAPRFEGYDETGATASAAASEQQWEPNEAEQHGQIISEYTDAWDTLTRKMNTIRRLHAREKEQLQATIRDLERAAATSSKTVASAKKQTTKAQEKKRRMEKEARDARREIAKAHEESKKAKEGMETHKDHRTAWKNKHDALAASVSTQGELKLRISIGRLEQQLNAAKTGTTRANEDAKKAQNVTSQATLTGALNPACETNVHEKERFNNDLRDLERTSATKALEISKLKRRIAKEQKERRKAEEEARYWKSRHLGTNMALTNANNHTAQLHGKYDAVIEDLNKAHWTAGAWEAEYMKLRSSLNNQSGIQY
ncbi:hypothetical protein SLS59_009659 [Nothophoma quercina]|uniref:Uncharacterized protein n=1 Tax=Nothophoma quercina TaxID=749835 RepID=A0ABR3QK92_9PLEO